MEKDKDEHVLYFGNWERLFSGAPLTPAQRFMGEQAAQVKAGLMRSERLRADQVRDEEPPTYGDGERGLRRWTEEPVGPLRAITMALGRELHDRERPGDDWFGLVGSSVSSFCRRACEARGIDWKWVLEALQREDLDERTELR